MEKMICLKVKKYLKNLKCLIYSFLFFAMVVVISDSPYMGELGFVAH